jgi:predicted regulator of Ras-like GTPase activity (Roadblock/LC7/MglB family)
MRSLIILLLLLSAAGTAILLMTGVSKATAFALIIVMTVSAIVLISILRFSPRRARVALGPEVERALAKLALELPGPNWVAVVSTDGFMASCFPTTSMLEMEDRLSSMSAAVFSLGSRISRELHAGDLRYSIVAGTETITLTVALDEDYMLSIGISSSVSLDSVLGTVHQSVASLQQELNTHQSVG